jgi:hypothetical protein
MRNLKVGDVCKQINYNFFVPSPICTIKEIKIVDECFLNIGHQHKKTTFISWTGPIHYTEVDSWFKILSETKKEYNIAKFMRGEL